MQKNEFVSWCDRTIVFSYCALIYFLPISIALVETFSTIIITLYFCKRGMLHVLGQKDGGVVGFFKSFNPAASPLNKAIGVFLIINLLSVIFSHDPALSTKRFIFKLFQEIVLFFGFLECMNSKKRIRNFMGIFLISLTLIVINGLAQFFTGKGFVHGHLLADGRVLSSFKQANDLGAYLIIGVMFLLSLFMTCGLFRKAMSPADQEACKMMTWPMKLVLLALFGAALTCLGLTFSRGAWIGFLAGLVFLGVLKRRQVLLTLLTAAVFFAIFIPMLVDTRNVSFISDDVHLETHIFKEQVELGLRQEQLENTSIAGMLHTTTRFGGMGRKEYWLDALRMVYRFPLLGTGLNTYSHMVEKYQLAGRGYPHNCYLQMAAETGLLGLGAFLWILFVLFRNGIRGYRHMQNPFLKIVVSGTLAGLFGFLSHSLGDTNFYSVKLGCLLWIMMGLAVTAQKIDITEQNSPVE